MYKEYFKNIQAFPPDPIFGLMRTFLDDPRPEKVNLVIGAYRTADLQPYILPIVKEVEQILIKTERSKDYLEIDGDPLFLKLSKELVFGSSEDRIYSAQTIGGTAALRVGAEFFLSVGIDSFALPAPTWANHPRIFRDAGLSIETYPYYNPEMKGFDCGKMMAYLQTLKPGTGVLLHACCHNPTGSDPTFEEWQKICACMQERELFPFFDLAYQGFGDSLPEDAAAVRLFYEKGFEFGVAYSFSKNFGLYAERCGALFVVSGDSEKAGKIGSQIRLIIRGMYSNPASHGSMIVRSILGDHELRKRWESELKLMRERIHDMRARLVSALNERLPSSTYDFLFKQKGMFSYTGLQAAQVECLTGEFGIYLPKDGRINVAGLNRENIPYVADAIASSL